MGEYIPLTSPGIFTCKIFFHFVEFSDYHKSYKTRKKIIWIQYLFIFYPFQINEDVMLGKCPPIYHRSEPEADDANSDLDSDNQQAAVGE